MSQPTHRKQPAGHRFFLVGGAGLIAAAALVLLIVLAQTPSASPAPHFVEVAPGGGNGEALRTIVVARKGETLPHMSAANTFLMTSLVAGDLPPGATQGVILSDSNCQPDADGVSHCLNDMRVGDTTVTLRHHHDMSEVPCLTPGETVRLLSEEQYRKL